jgi:hypothetical protein
MSDLGRKGFGDSSYTPQTVADYSRSLLTHHQEASEAVKPDSQKGVGEKLGEGASDIGDKVSR